MQKAEVALRLKLLGAEVNTFGLVSASSLRSVVAKYEAFSVKQMNKKFKSIFLSALAKAGWTTDNILSGSKATDTSPVVVKNIFATPEENKRMFASVIKQAETGYLGSVLRDALSQRELYTDKEFGALKLHLRAQGSSEQFRKIDVLDKNGMIKEEIGSFSFEPSSSDKLGGSVELMVYGVGKISFDYKDFGRVDTEFKVSVENYKKIMSHVINGVKKAISGIKDKSRVGDQHLD